jgi:hypothetical protein
MQHWTLLADYKRLPPPPQQQQRPMQQAYSSLP